MHACAHAQMCYMTFWVIVSSGGLICPVLQEAESATPAVQDTHFSTCTDTHYGYNHDECLNMCSSMCLVTTGLAGSACLQNRTRLPYINSNKTKTRAQPAGSRCVQRKSAPSRQADLEHHGCSNLTSKFEYQTRFYS